MLTEVCSRGVAESTRMSLFHRSPGGGGRPALGHDVWIDIGLREQSE